MRSISRWVILAVFLAMAGVTGGCGGGGAKVQTSSTTTTKGQELMDLEKAYKQGILTESEYKKQKKKILKRD